MRNVYIFNCEAQINYIVGYIYFINCSYSSKASKNDFSNSNFWYKQYLSVSLIDYAIVNKLSVSNLIFLDVNHLYKATTI